MIKLKDILNEISLMSGDASASELDDLYSDVIKYLPKKYRVVDGYMRWIVDPSFEPSPGQKRTMDAAADIEAGKKLIGYDKDHIRWGKEFLKAKSLINMNSEFISDVDKSFSRISREGGFELRLHESNRGKNLEFYLTDRSAKYINQFFIGVIKVEKKIGNYRSFDLKKSFNIQEYTIHWSNVAKEFRGQGMGRTIYKMVYDYVTQQGGALTSDSILFQGSQKMWKQFMPEIASYFGAVYDQVVYPVPKSEIAGAAEESSVDRFIAMEDVPLELRKLSANLKGLSFLNGDYGIIQCRENINKKLVKFSYLSWSDKDQKKAEKEFTYFSNLVDESVSLRILFKKLNDLDFNYSLRSYNTTEEKIKTGIFAFENATVIVKETGGRLVMVAI